MKRSYDYSFVNDTDNITNTTDVHSLQQPTATPATHTPIGFYATIPTNTFFNEHADVNLLRPTLEFRVPLLASSVGFNPDFQSNTGRQSDMQGGNSFCQSASNPTTVSHQLTGLGIRYESSYDAIEGSPSVRQTAILPSERPLFSPPATSHDLSLHDICHVDSSPGLGFSECCAEVNHDQAGRNSEPLCDVLAYSVSPTRDYTAHAPSTSSSIPSLSRDSGSDGSLSDSLDASSVKDNLRNLLDLYSPQLRLTKDAIFHSEPLVGLFADFNMRELVTKHELPELGVNPADIMGEDIYVKTEEPEVFDTSSLENHRSPALERSVNLDSGDATDAAFPDEAINAIVSLLSASKREEDARAVELPHDTSCTPMSVKGAPFLLQQVISAQPAVPVRSSATETAYTPFSFISPGLLALQPPGRAPLTDIYAPQEAPEVIPAEPLPPVVKSQSPVLNAHLGIELDDLRRRAEEFRRANPGLDIDKTWLQAYAGRLSQRGELIDDYRCYVVGCSQKNKRRDHILVHVGSHVEHRPFQCSHCGMRFLRKNECKRHESSHGGHKPFRCPICAPFQDRSFVRQDLLKRHMRVTHGVQAESAADRRKRMRVMAEDEYWP